MSTVLRLAVILFVVAVAALVMLPCGAAESDACLHACCDRPRSVGGAGHTFVRMVAALSPFAARVSHLPSLPLLPEPLRTAVVDARSEVMPLRI